MAQEVNGDEKEQQGTDLLSESNGTSDNAQTDKRPKKKRRTRAQRRKEKIIRDRPTIPREIILNNDNLVKFYKLQPFLESTEEFAEFMLALRTTLPASFRINAFDYEQSKILRHLVQKQFEEFLSSSQKLEIEQVIEIEADTNKNEPQHKNNPYQYDQSRLSNSVPTIEQLIWYPKGLAWQMSVTRLDLKKSSILQNLHKFIMAETENGFISRQESVSMIPPLVLDVHRGQNILDMCAAPGSKTAQLLEYLRIDIHGKEDTTTTIKAIDNEHLYEEGLVVANDVDNKRCYMLVHQSNRLNSPNCVIINEDASKLPDMKIISKNGTVDEIKFDRILCDAPCTGDGTVRKNPDVWRKWSVANANNFHGLQSKILRRGVEMLKEGGLLVYSTCSMNPVEDEAVVASVLRLGQGALVLEDVSQKLQGLKYQAGLSNWVVMNREMEIIQDPNQVKPELVSQIHKSLFPPTQKEIESFSLHRCIRILPHLQNTGAFFVAVIRKLRASLPHEEEKLEVSKVSERRADREDAIEKPSIKQKPKRSRLYHGFKEQPFIFLDPEDADWKTIKDFYGIVDNFPVEQLCHRCASSKKRSIHLVSKQTRGFIAANQEIAERKEFVKVINGGMRLFMRAETEAGFRICQDGLHEILPYIKSDLKVSIDKNDLIALLEKKTVPFDQLSSKSLFKDRLKVGSCVTVFEYANINLQQEPIEIPLVAWRGERSLALYVSKTYKVHLRALVYDKLPDQS